MAGQVCVDASLILTLLLPDALTLRTKSLWQSWVNTDIETVSAPLFFAEVTSVLRESVHFGRITAEEGETAFSAFMQQGVKRIDIADLQPRAWNLAKAHRRPRAYDAQYLAVAEALGCELWTADRRLVNEIHLPWLRSLADYAPDSG